MLLYGDREVELGRGGKALFTPRLAREKNR